MSSAIEIKTYFGRCRCCLNYGYLKNMWEEHQWEGEKEVYVEMLVQCFALSWEHSDDSMEHDQICEACIKRLRDAYTFKKVILESQEELLGQIDESETAIKIEKPVDKEDYTIDAENEGDHMYIDDPDDPDYVDPDDPDDPDDPYGLNDPDDSNDTNDPNKIEYEEVEYLEDEKSLAAHNTIYTEDANIQANTFKLLDAYRKLKLPTIKKDFKNKPEYSQWPRKDIITKNINLRARNIFSSLKNQKDPIHSFEKTCQCRKRCYENITKEYRRKIFKLFWGKNTWAEKRAFILTCVKEKQKERERIRSLDGISSRKRDTSRKYYFFVDNEQIEVCQKYFLNTLEISVTFVTNALKRYRLGMTLANKREKGLNNKNIT